MMDENVASGVAVYEVEAVNYATDSSNKIHSDEVAKQYGFVGGLVPGVAVCCYMMQPPAVKFGLEWARGGSFRAKLLKPIYEGEKAKVTASTSADDPDQLEIEVKNPAGVLCAVGAGGIGRAASAPEVGQYPVAPMPERDARMEPTASALPKGETLGTLLFGPGNENDEGGFFAKAREQLDICTSEEPLQHPGLLLHLANYVVSGNVALGPWIHTASEIQFYNAARVGETLELRGKIEDSYERRGHEFIVADLAAFGAEGRPIAQIRHTAIVKPRAVSS